MKQEAEKISIIGIGNVGATTAYTLLVEGLVNELVLVSRSQEKANGEKLDLEHSLPFLKHARIYATTKYKDIKDSDIVVVTAGVKQKAGESRSDVVVQNSKIIEDIIPKIVKNASDAIIIIVSNPVDILTLKASQLSKLPPGKIIGTGTMLDTARFRFHLSEFLKVNPRSIHAYILGEHGDSSFPVLSSATIGGRALRRFPGYSDNKALEAFEKARTAAYRIINAKGATYYAIAVVTSKLIEAILRDTKSVLPASIPLDGFYGHQDVALSVPCIIGEGGAENVVELSLSDDEQEKLAKSVETLKRYL